MNLDVKLMHRVVRFADGGIKWIAMREAELFHSTAETKEIVAVRIQRVAQLPGLSIRQLR